MLQKLSLALIGAFVVLSACKKDETITPAKKRYQDEIFSKVTVQTTVYSTVTNFEMDIYMPEGDTETKRPLVVLSHGGGFIQGSKENPAMIRLGENLAKRGYVAVSINYHLAANAGVMLDSARALDVVVKALGDGKAAIRFMRKSYTEGNPYGIDTSRVFAAGISAGGVISVHLGLFDAQDPVSAFLEDAISNNGGFEGNRGNPGYASHISAVVNMAGAIKTVALIDGNDVPILNFHGVDDDVVPYYCGDVFSSLGLNLVDVCGSGSIQIQAEAVGLNSTLHSYPGKHVPWMDIDTGVPNLLFNQVESKTFDFLYQQL